MAKRTTTSQSDPTADHANYRQRFEQWANNPECQANVISALRNVPMNKVADSINLPTRGHSPFALARGVIFEKDLFRNHGERLLKSLSRVGILPTDASGFVDFRIKANAGQRLATIDQAIAESRQLLQQIGKPDNKTSSLPALVAGLTLSPQNDNALANLVLILDAVAIDYRQPLPKLIIGEVKIYADRGGHTAPGDLNTARTQAGIYLHVLELIIEELDLLNRLEVSPSAFLVLTQPGNNFPSIRYPEEIRYQAIRAQRGLKMYAAAIAELSSLKESEKGSSADISSVLQAETRYCDNCLAFCDLAERCAQRSLIAGEAMFLGEEVNRYLGSISLPRAIELLSGASPQNPVEQNWVNQVKSLEKLERQ